MALVVCSKWSAPTHVVYIPLSVRAGLGGGGRLEYSYAPLRCGTRTMFVLENLLGLAVFHYCNTCTSHSAIALARKSACKEMLSYLCVSVFWFLGALHPMMVYSHEVPYLTHQGVFIANHSYVNTSLLGQTNGVYVRCHSDSSVCCDRHPNQGRWFYPNGSLLQSLQNSYNVYVLADGQQVALRRRNDPQYCERKTTRTVHLYSGKQQTFL